MSKINKRHRIMIIAIITILFSLVTYYIYANTEEGDVISYNEALVQDNTNTAKKETKESKDNNLKSVIVVHVAGCVAHPGIVKLEENSRISDAIDSAGGITKDADISKINLAFLLEDGMKIYIPSHNENKEGNAMNNCDVSSEDYVTSNSGVQNLESNSSRKSNSSSSASTKKDANLKVNINTASQSELETLPGIGSATALKIVTYRNENGKFQTIDDIKNVKGIGNSKFEKIKDLICVK